MTLVPVYVRGCVSAGAIAPTVSEEKPIDAYVAFIPTELKESRISANEKKLHPQFEISNATTVCGQNNRNFKDISFSKFS